MTPRIVNRKAVFFALGAVALGLTAASASKAVKSAQKKPAAKTAAKPAAGKPAAAKAAVKSAPQAAAPVGSAGWVYRKPGSPMPQVTAPRAVQAPRQIEVKDPRDGVQIAMPPMTYSVATIGTDGKVNYNCETEEQAKARVKASAKSNSKSGSKAAAGHTHR